MRAGHRRAQHLPRGLHKRRVAAVGQGNHPRPLRMGDPGRAHHLGRVMRKGNHDHHIARIAICQLIHDQPRLGGGGHDVGMGHGAAIGEVMRQRIAHAHADAMHPPRRQKMRHDRLHRGTKRGVEGGFGIHQCRIAQFPHQRAGAVPCQRPGPRDIAAVHPAEGLLHRLACRGKAVKARRLHGPHHDVGVGSGGFGQPAHGMEGQFFGPRGKPGGKAAQPRRS